MLKSPRGASTDDFTTPYDLAKYLDPLEVVIENKSGALHLLKKDEQVMDKPIAIYTNVPGIGIVVHAIDKLN